MERESADGCKARVSRRRAGVVPRSQIPLTAPQAADAKHEDRDLDGKQTVSYVRALIERASTVRPLTWKNISRIMKLWNQAKSGLVALVRSGSSCVHQRLTKAGQRPAHIEYMLMKSLPFVQSGRWHAAGRCGERSGCVSGAEHGLRPGGGDRSEHWRTG